MGEANILIEFASEINSHTIRHFSNQPEKNHKQSAVAIIFRCSPTYEKLLNLAHFQGAQNKINFFIPSKEKLKSLFTNFIGVNSQEIFEILFLQRAFCEKDLHSGEICFPGGKCDENETDYEAVIREVKEEIDYDLMTEENSLYLGKLPKNFYVYLSKNGKLYVTVHIFLVLNYEKISKNSKFNDREVCDIRWLPFRNLLFPSSDTLILKKVQAKKNWTQNYPKIVQKLFNILNKKYDHSEYAGLDVGMKETLYGLTYFMVIYMLWVITHVWRENLEGKKQLERMLFFSNYNKMIFKNETFVEKLGGWAGGRWYKKQRIDQFKYSKSQDENLLKKIVYLVCYFLIVYLILRFFEIL